MANGAHSLGAEGRATTVAELLARNGGPLVRGGATSHAAPTPMELTAPIPVPRAFRREPKAMPAPAATHYLTVEPPGAATVLSVNPEPSRFDEPAATKPRGTRHWKLATAGAAGLALAGAMLVGSWAPGLAKESAPGGLADGHALTDGHNWAQKPQSGQPEAGPSEPVVPVAPAPLASVSPVAESPAAAPDEGQFTGTLPVGTAKPPAPTSQSTPPPATTTRATTPATTSSASQSATPPPTSTKSQAPDRSNQRGKPGSDNRGGDQGNNGDGGGRHHRH